MEDNTGDNTQLSIAVINFIDGFFELTLYHAILTDNEPLARKVLKTFRDT